MIENYIVINGKRAELTEEQMKALGIEVKKDPFARAKDGNYYTIVASGDVARDFHSNGCIVSDLRYEVANYCTDKALMEQRALHETLSRRLWRYSMQHGGEKIDFGKPHNKHYFICRCVEGDYFYTALGNGSSISATYFVDKKTAEAAIEEVVKPFMEQHQEFKW